MLLGTWGDRLKWSRVVQSGTHKLHVRPPFDLFGPVFYSKERPGRGNDVREPGERT